jgi:ABC-type dipeptide/oligopeptide/nickel transport system permease subunit
MPQNVWFGTQAHPRDDKSKSASSVVAVLVVVVVVVAATTVVGVIADYHPKSQNIGGGR